MAVNIKEFKNEKQVKIKFNKRDILINKYIALETKMAIQRVIFAQCFDEDGYFDWVLYDMYFKCLVLQFYTDLKFPTTKIIVDGKEQRVNDVHTIYDIAVESKLYDKVARICYRDIEKLEEIIIDSIDEKRRNFEYKHSISAMLGDFLSKMMNVDPKDFGKVIDQLSNVDALKNLDLIQKIAAKNVKDNKEEG